MLSQTLLYRRKLPDSKKGKSAKNFIHLNLSLTLLLTFTVFVLCIETASKTHVSALSFSLYFRVSPPSLSSSSFPFSLPLLPLFSSSHTCMCIHAIIHLRHLLYGGCAFVAAILHYLFLSAFCWMLCEGILLYLLLLVVQKEVAILAHWTP